MTRGGGGEPDTLPVSFARAMDSIRSVVLRSEVHVEETPAPQRLSPYAIALQATVVVDPRGEDEAASGRFVLLHDPAGQEPWDGTFRIVTFAKGTVEIDIAGDPMLTEVAWSWLLESLADHGALFHAESGTVTRTSSQAFGAIGDRIPQGDVEIRASWTPGDDAIGEHVQAWVDVLTHIAGLPPLPSGVAPLSSSRAAARRQYS